MKSLTTTRWLAVGAILSTSPSLWADEAPTDTAATAEALFREGRAAMTRGDYASACPKLASSYEIDPATGALLALALCYERAGRIASAWSAYVEAEQRARREGRQDRAESARDRIAALEPRLPKLTISIGTAVAGLPGWRLERDGVLVARAATGLPIPVDPGDHTLVVTADGYERAVKKVTVEERSTKEVVFADPLVRIRPERAAPPQKTTEGAPLDPFQIAGISVGGAGLTLLAVGSGYGIVAMQKNADSNEDCDADDFCGPRGKRDRLDAIEAGNVSTGLFVAGGVAAAVGTALFALGTVVGDDATTEKATTFLLPALTTAEWGVAIEGTW